MSIDIKCYGCGKSGFIKSKCPNCKTKNLTGVASLNVIEENLESNDNLGQNEETTEVIDFFSIMLEESYVQSRPLVSIDICGSHGLALIDTAAMISIASKSLFNVLRKNKIVFEPKNITIKLADDSVKTISVPMCQVPIILKQRSFATTIVALPDATHTLLGIDFLVKAGIVVDFYNRTWRFADSNIVFPLIHENKNINSSRSDMTNHSEIIKISSIEVLRSDEGTNLSTEERHRVEDMLAQNHITFAPGGAPTTYIEHHINTGTSRPISVPPYSMTPIKREILTGELNKMLDDDIIEECESPWSAPVVLVPKPNGSHRLCIDYRKLNAVTISDRYPMPKIDDLLHLAKRSLYMSTTDLRSGYWQVPVREEDRDKTAFISPFGLFRFKRMPFGLKNAPSTFQRLIDRLRNSLPDIVILAYLDDLIIISTSFEEHLADIERLFKQLNKYNLRANRDKCVFFRTSVKFLGHIIAENGIHPNPDKISAISKMIPPKNLSHLKTFLATCSWYRKFVPNFAEKSSILSALTKKNAPWNWNLEHQTAFEVLKNALTTSPVLQQVDYGKPFILRTDASNYAVGAVLLQKTEDGDEKPIEYASRLLTQAERNYSTSEREALAVVWALKKYQGYLDGAEVTLGTDHQPLRWLMTLRSPSGRLARWALLIQSFNLNIEYIPGKANVVADYLSRPPTDDALEMYSFQVTMPINNISDIREKQLNDPDLKKIINCFEAIDHTDLRNWTDRGYLMNSGILYRYIPDQDNEEAQLVLPETMRGDILKAYHAEPTAGHYGVEKTYMKIANHYFWPGMRRNIENFIKNCLECQKYKPTNLKPAGLLRTPIMLQRMEKISIDLIGPLTKSITGHQWVLVIEDTTTRWTELFALISATSENCAKVLLNEWLLRYGLPRKLVSDNGPQFISSIMQHVTDILGIQQQLTPVYHPQANPVERRNRDIKTQLAILVGNHHENWSIYLPSIRFAMNSTTCSSTGFSPAYFTFGRELRCLSDVINDFRTIVENENFIPEITPYLSKMKDTFVQAREINERQQDKRKMYADQKRRDFHFNVSDRVLIKTHTLSKCKAFS